MSRAKNETAHYRRTCIIKARYFSPTRILLTIQGIINSFFLDEPPSSFPASVPSQAFCTCLSFVILRSFILRRYPLPVSVRPPRPTPPPPVDSISFAPSSPNRSPIFISPSRRIPLPPRRRQAASSSLTLPRVSVFGGSKLVGRGVGNEGLSQLWPTERLARCNGCAITSAELSGGRGRRGLITPFYH